MILNLCYFSVNCDNFEKDLARKKYNMILKKDLCRFTSLKPKTIRNLMKITRFANSKDLESDLYMISIRNPTIYFTTNKKNHTKTKYIKINLELNIIAPLKIGDTTMVAIMGQSGLGKSTLLAAICGHLPSTGIYINGNCSYYAHHLRKDFSTVAQRPILLGDTLFTSFTAVNPNVTEEDVLKILSKLGFDRQMIEPRLHTHLSDVKSGFSGGQEQRITIAISLMKQARLLSMDEPTSALDEKNTCIVYALTKLKTKKKTQKDGAIVLVVTHKMIMEADLVIFLYKEKNKITGEDEINAFCGNPVDTENFIKMKEQEIRDEIEKVINE